jgi:hypothetical protein
LTEKTRAHYSEDGKGLGEIRSGAAELTLSCGRKQRR